MGNNSTSKGQLKTKLRKNQWVFLIALVFFAAFSALMAADYKMNAQNTTAFAFSYKYGFVSRALVPSFLGWLDGLVPMQLLSYTWIYRLSLVATLFLYILIFAFFVVCLKACDDRKLSALIMFFGVFTFPMFVTEYNFGRLDTYLYIISFICILLLFIGKVEWLIVPLCIVAMLVHHGFVFTNANIILALLLYKAIISTDKRKYYTSVLICTFVVISALFLYFEFAASYPNPEQDVVQIKELAMSLSLDGMSINDSIIDHEVLGLDVFNQEKWMHEINYLETPIFLILFSPYIALFVLFVKQLKRCSNNRLYMLLLLGSLTMLPEIVLKVDFGRYVYGIIFYYLILLIFLYAYKDETAKKACSDTLVITEKIVPWWLVIAYAVIFVPFYDVHIDEIVKRIADVIRPFI